MSPEKLIHGLDPQAAPFLFGMVVKIKDFVAVKALTAAVVLAFSVGIFYNQTNAMIDKVDKFIVRLEKLESAMIIFQRTQYIASNNIGHIRSDIDKLTAQMGQMHSNIAKLRR
jgi:2C-methyl-D-erythritol 2,4-cyclodiphosphate synthase